MATFAHTAVLWFSEIDWSHPDWPDWYSFDYRAADECEVPSTHQGGRSYPSSKQREREGMNAVNLFDIDLLFDEKERVAVARLEKSLNVVPDKHSQWNVGEGSTPEVVKALWGFQGLERNTFL